MGYLKFTTITLVSVLVLCNQVTSQQEGPARQGTVNGPTGISIEAERRANAPVFVNGPTSFSVEAEEQKKNNNGGFEPMDVDLGATDDDGNPRYVEDDVDLDAIDNDQDLKGFVNGHSGSSVEHRQKTQALAQGSGRRILPDNPDDGKKDAELMKGLHILTTDWSTDASDWSFKGGDWALVNLPDRENHPSLPPPLVPGPALAVVTDNPLNKVEAYRTIEGLENMTLHFSYFLTEGNGPHGIPELNVYQVKDDNNLQLVSTAETHGVWSEVTTELPFDGSSKIIFVGRLNQDGNEIAIDDITISGVSGGPTEKDNEEIIMEKKASSSADEESVDVSSAQSATESANEQEGTTQNAVANSENSQNAETGKTGEASAETTTSGLEQGTGNLGENGQVTENPQVTQETTLNSNITLQGNDTDHIVESSSVPQLGNATFENNTGIPELTNHSNDMNETVTSAVTENPVVLQGNDTINQTAVETSTSVLGEVTDPGNETDVTEFVFDNSTNTSLVNNTVVNSTEVSQVNQTSWNNFTTEIDHSIEGNDTDIFETTLPSNLTEIIDYNVTNNLTNSSVVATIDLGTVNTDPSVLMNETNTDSSVSVNENITDPSILINVTNFESSILINENSTDPSILINVTNSESSVLINENNTDPSILMNGTGSVVNTNFDNVTEYSTNNDTNEGNGTTSVYLTTAQGTSDNSSNPPLVGTSDQGVDSNTTTSISLIMNNSTSSSGANGTSPGLGSGSGNGNESDEDDGTWSAFKIFVIVCVLGVAVMGFLYWRRQRRRDDEIPVFSRSASADYHNPTFSDDDANFASRGTSHNYKSFD